MPKVMVVDDAYSELQVMETILRSAGYDVLTYLDGEQLEEKIVKDRPDVVLLDIGLPGMTGYEVVGLLRKDPRLSRTLMVALTGFGQESDRVRSREAGFDEHLVKPVELDAITRLVRKHLGRGA